LAARHRPSQDRDYIADEEGTLTESGPASDVGQPAMTAEITVEGALDAALIASHGLAAGVDPQQTFVRLGHSSASV
jgi:hypothetical protein